MDLTKELSELIEKHLPKATGDVLQKRLAAIDSLEKSCAAAIEMRDKLQAENTTLRAEATAVAVKKQANEDAAKSLTQREALVAKREDDCKFAELKVLAAQSAKSDIMDLCKIVFRNPRFVTTESATVCHPNPNGYMMTGNENKTTTREEE